MSPLLINDEKTKDPEKVVVVFSIFFLSMHVGGIFCVLAKAPDCVNYEILLVKLVTMAFKEQ
jgi:hypothetical protein